ncbi:MAG: xanthine dehydrogenase family protein molybdopterin-binding subunit [Deltaproteobacteria bacterium]|nr:xanthine dehydrogenase family protein molybdopterin-binding subunit [Deltaproteobacteria bacterium]
MPLRAISAVVPGTFKYIQDLSLPGMLYGKILFSKYAHARIAHVDTSRAEKLLGVRAVITAQNTPEIRFGFYKDNVALKGGKVRSYRDEVAAVAAVDPDIAAEAVRLIRVEYEPLPGVFDPFEAMKEGAPLVHEEHKGNVLKLPWKFIAGDPDSAREQSAYEVEDRYEVTWVTHCCMGTSGCVAVFDVRNNLTLYSTTQIPHLAIRDFNNALTKMGINNPKTRIVKTTIGGAFGSKLDTHPFEYIAVLLAHRTHKPVKIVFDRTEEFFATPGRQPAVIDIAQGCDTEGRLTFRDVRMVLDNGAYTSWGATTPTVMMMPVSSLYKVPNVRYSAKCVYTNNLYCQAMRGYGNPQATFAIESQIDHLAEEAGMDPYEFRVLNANEPGETTPQEFKITTCGLCDCLDAVARNLNWKTKRGKGDMRRGVGMASLIHVGGGARVYKSDGCGTIIKMDDYGKIDLFTGATDIGQGSETVIAQVVAEELGLFVEDINVIDYDTDVCPWDVGVHASRTTFVACNSALGAARKIKARILEMASRILATDPSDLSISRRVVSSKSNPDRSIMIDKLLRDAHYSLGGRMLMSEYFYDPQNENLNKEFKGNLSMTYSYGAHGIEVEVDTATGKVRILDYVAAHDVGRAINPMLLEGQVQGGALMGVGYALTERLILDKGEVMNPNFRDYKILTAADAVRVKPIIVETEDSEGPFGAKGIGEPGCVPSAPALANAIYDAVGVRIRDLPITPEKVLRALKERARKEAPGPQPA